MNISWLRCSALRFGRLLYVVLIISIWLIGSTFWLEATPVAAAVPMQERAPTSNTPGEHTFVTANPGDGAPAQKARIVDLAAPSVTLALAIGYSTPTNNSLIGVKITFSTVVTDFTLSALTLTNATAINLTGSGTTYNFTLVPIAEGTASVQLPANIVHDADGNGNSVSNTLNVVYDITAPIGTINLVTGLTDPTNSSPITVDIVFNELISGLGLSDLVVSNATASGLSGSNPNFRVVLTPQSNGTVTIRLPATNMQDRAGNNLAADAVLSVVYDNVRPTATLSFSGGLSSPTNSSPMAVDVIFSESVTGFALSDLTLTNATASNLSGSGSNYSFDVTPSADGTVGVSLPANRVQDLAGNNNTISNSLSVVYDGTGPTVVLSLAGGASNPTNSAPIGVDITFSEAMTGFALGDLVLTNATASNLSGSGTSYSFDLTPNAEGTLSVQFPANVLSDAVGNGNSASNILSIEYDITAPTVTLSLAGGASDPTNSSPIGVDITFSESVTGFALSDLTLTNATASNLSGSGSNYSFDVIPSADGMVSVFLPAASVQDIAGNDNGASNTLDVVYDSTPPSVTVSFSGGLSSPTNSSPIGVDITFSESVTGLGLSDFVLTNATASNLSGSGSDYSFDVIPSADGTVSMFLPAASVQDIAGNDNGASNTLDVVYDSTPPTVTIEQTSSQADPANSAPILFDVQFSETVSGFDESDISISGTASASNASVTGSGSSYQVSISGMTQAGTVIVSIPANKASDAAGNGNTASTSSDQQVTFDPDNPVATGIVRVNANPTKASSVAFTITFSEDVLGVDSSDFVPVMSGGLSGASVSSVIGSGQFYTVTVDTGMGSGTLGLNLHDDDSIHDLSMNALGGSGTGNGAFTGAVYQVDRQAPSVTGLTVGVALEGRTTLTFTLDISDNLSLDVSSLSNSNFQVTGPNGFSQNAAFVDYQNGIATYSVAAPGGIWDLMDNGSYDIALVAGQIQDSLGNSSAARLLGSFEVAFPRRVYLPMISAPGQADLMASIAITPAQSTFTTSTQVEINVTVTNHGDATASGFWVDLYLNPSSVPTAANQIWNTNCGITPCYGGAWWVAQSLAPGASITLSSNDVALPYSYWPKTLAAGTTDIYVYVDSWGNENGTVNESNEHNNSTHVGGLRVTGSNLQHAALQSLPMRPR